MNLLLKKFIVVATVIVNVCVLSVCSVSAQLTAIQESDLNFILKESNLEKMTENFALNFYRGFTQSGEMENTKEVKSIIYYAFRKELMFQMLKDEMITNYNEDYVQKWKVICGDAFYKEVLDREQYTTTEEGILAFGKFSKNFLNEHYATASRIALVKKLLEISGSADLGVNVASSIFKLMLSSMSEAFGKSYNEATATQFVEQMKPKIVETLLLQYIFIYEPFTDEQLEKYTKIYEDDAGRWLVTQVNAGFNKGALVGGETFSKNFVQYMKGLQQQESEKAVTKP